MRRILAVFYLKFSFPGGSLPRVFVFITDSPPFIERRRRASRFARSFYFNVDKLSRSFLSYRRLLELKRGPVLGRGNSVAIGFQPQVTIFMDISSHDVLLVGGGGAGLRAAIAVSEFN